MRTNMKSSFALGALALALVGIFATTQPAQAAWGGSVSVDTGPRYYTSYNDGPYYRRNYYPRTYSRTYYYPRTYYYEPSSATYYDDYYWDGYTYRPRYYVSGSYYDGSRYRRHHRSRNNFHLGFSFGG